MAGKFSSVYAVAAAALCFIPSGGRAQGSDARALIERAADALGVAQPVQATLLAQASGT